MNPSDPSSDVPPNEPAVLSPRERSNANLCRGPAPGVQRGSDGRLRKASEAADAAAAPHDGPVDVIAEMEAILSRPEEEDRTPFQRSLREWYEDDFKGFMRQLVTLRAGKKGEAKSDVTSDLGHDQGTERALAVLDRVLLEIAGKVRGQCVRQHC